MPLLLSIIKKSKCQTNLKIKKKKKGIMKDTKEKIAYKLVVAQVSTFCIVLNFVVFPILNNYSKRNILQSEKLLAEHANDKFQMDG
jgi:hypothetical protein